MNPWRRISSRHDGRPPAWWPRDELWPPRGRQFHAQRRRARFVRRSGWYSFLPLWWLLWMVANGWRWSTGAFPIGGGTALVFACAVAAAAVAVVIRRMAAPVADIVSAADRIAQRDYRVRVPVPDRGPAWMGDTARAFNAMAKELDTQEQARRHLMADIAHELRTPLAVVQGKLEGLIDGVYPRDSDQLQGLLDDTRVVARLVEDLRTLSSTDSGALALSKEPTDIVALAHDVVSSLAHRAEDAGIALRVDARADEEIEPITVDPLRVREVLTNLVANGLRHTPNGGHVVIAISTRTGGVDIRVIDSGAGMSESELARIFDRFYKGAGSSGSGLGLTIARNLVEAHGGTIRAESRLGVGTTMIVSLPR